ncbi:MAG: hypothetical protein KatS3mg087_1152 [Patescibacteria group bacterium]|nr:MAG: hypothetical protein KatS3mg087_1152 [Patescibacteria group bacterium]
MTNQNSMVIKTTQVKKVVVTSWESFLSVAILDDSGKSKSTYDLSPTSAGKPGFWFIRHESGEPKSEREK